MTTKRVHLLKLEYGFMKTFRYHWVMIGLLAAAGFLASGCRSSWWPFGRKDDIAGSFTGPAPLPMPSTPLPTQRPKSAEWEPLGAPVQPRPGSIVPIKDLRWEGVVVYFAYDSSAVGTSERPKLEALAEYLKAHPSYSVLVEGHCDQRGSEEYNRALGERRALAVKEYLAGLGIDPSRIDTISYGEDRPIVVDPKDEADYQKNRRAEFVIGIRR